MMNAVLVGVVIFSILGAAVAYPGQYVPRAYYVIDREGHESDLVYLRTRRALDMFPLLRQKRGGASSFSSASASSSSSSSSGAGDSPIYFGGQDAFPNSPNQGYSNINPDFNNGYNHGGGSGLHPGANRGFAGGGVSSDSGNPASNFEHYNNDAGPTLFSRFGEDVGSSINANSASSGKKGSFSSSSSSVDGDGKITFAVKSGKY